jgi:hypothetical protein
MRPVGASFSFGGRTERTVMPSISTSASIRTMSPTLEPFGSSDVATAPFGCRAPAARHVKVSSSRALVSSTSIR